MAMCGEGKCLYAMLRADSLNKTCCIDFEDELLVLNPRLLVRFFGEAIGGNFRKKKGY